MLGLVYTSSGCRMTASASAPSVPSVGHPLDAPVPGPRLPNSVIVRASPDRIRSSGRRSRDSARKEQGARRRRTPCSKSLPQGHHQQKLGWGFPGTALGVYLRCDQIAFSRTTASSPQWHPTAQPPGSGSRSCSICSYPSNAALYINSPRHLPEPLPPIKNVVYAIHPAAAYHQASPTCKLPGQLAPAARMQTPLSSPTPQSSTAPLRGFPVRRRDPLGSGSCHGPSGSGPTFRSRPPPKVMSPTPHTLRPKLVRSKVREGARHRRVPV